jgi:hypothetical protein
MPALSESGRSIPDPIAAIDSLILLCTSRPVTSHKSKKWGDRFDVLGYHLTRRGLRAAAVILQDTKHVLGRERASHFDRQAFTSVLVDHGQEQSRQSQCHTLVGAARNHLGFTFVRLVRVQLYSLYAILLLQRST